MNQEVSPNSIVAKTILDFPQVHSLPAESVVELVDWWYIYPIWSASLAEDYTTVSKKDDGLLQHKNSIGATAHHDCTQVNSSSVESNTTCVEATSLESLSPLTLILD